MNSTLLVPRNSALQTLPRKPWQDKEEGPMRDDGKKGDLVWEKEMEDEAAEMLNYK